MSDTISGSDIAESLKIILVKKKYEYCKTRRYNGCE